MPSQWEYLLWLLRPYHTAITATITATTIAATIVATI